jgi:hypothetical protein
MSQLKLLCGTQDILDESGEIIATVSAMDLYYTTALAIEECPSTSRRDKMKYAAKIVNEEFGTSFSWGQVADLLTQLDAVVTEAKKNFTSMPE